MFLLGNRDDDFVIHQLQHPFADQVHHRHDPFDRVE